MNYLLKIVEGPNKGAEIALVEGVAVTLGKGDDCDIILADATMPETPVKLEASSGGVLLDDSPIEPCHVKTFGATSFAVGPADAPWGDLVWPKAEAEEESHADGSEAAAAGDASTEGSAPVQDTEEQPRSGKKSGCLGCLAVAVVLLLIAAGLCWFFREHVRPYAEKTWERISEMTGLARTNGVSSVANSAGTTGVSPVDSAPANIESIAAKYGLSVTNRANGAFLSGNLPTRVERLAATAEAYSAQPGVSVDISDDESFRTAAEDALFTLTEGRLKVVAATNRFLVIGGASPSSAALAKTLRALNSDMPKLRNVDVTRVSIGGAAATADEEPAAAFAGSARPKAPRKRHEPSRVPSFPVCGILTTPYKCLVLQNGMRIMEGGAIGDSVIMRIEADSVTVTNAMGRFTWRP